MAATSSPLGSKWTDDEHQRYLEAMELYPTGSWKQRASYVGTRSARQVMTHAQKMVLKAERHARGLQRAGRPRRARATQVESPREHPHDYVSVSVTNDVPATSGVYRVAWSPASDAALEELLSMLDEDDWDLPPLPQSPASPSTFVTELGDADDEIFAFLHFDDEYLEIDLDHLQ